MIDRFRAADWWAFGVFDVYEALVGLYRVDRQSMRPLIDVLERRMKTRVADGLALENNPKFPFSAVRPLATVLYFDDANYTERTLTRGVTIVRPSTE